jgi:mono/diheme cytochrome c family protein
MMDQSIECGTADRTSAPARSLELKANPMDVSRLAIAATNCLVTGFALAGLLMAELAPATEPKTEAVDGSAREFLAAHCRKCHTGEKSKGKFDVAGLTTDFSDKTNRERWLKVLERVRAGTMPPKESARPPRETVEAVADWISRQAAASQAADGRVVLRRLNRVEYQNTVRDLLAVDVDLKDLLPEDIATNGFDNSAEALHVSSFLMASYLEAADRVLDLAIANGSRPTTINKRYSIKDEGAVKPIGSVYRHVDDGVAIFSSWVSANIQVTLWQFGSRQRGQYRFRISAYGFQTDKPIMFHVLAGPLNAAAQQELVDYFTVPPGEPKVVEFVRLLEPQQTIRIVTDGLGATPPVVERVGADKYEGPGLVVQWVDVEGPLLESWPPPSHRRLLGDLPQDRVPSAQDSPRWEVVSQAPIADAKRILEGFTRRAFRRAVTDEDVKPFLARVQAKLEKGDSFEQALRVGLKSVLLSSHFLYLREKNDKAGKARLDDFALASRLSYFLWSSMPDDELLSLAESGTLHEPDELRQQVERMLRDRKASAFTENFAGQWLSLRSIDATMPDPMLYPEHDDVLQISMIKEVLLFFDEVLRNDLSLTNFVASDFSMLNGRLARHYGIPGVEGELEFQKVVLPPESHRGGVMTMAAVLKVTANGTTTSPILRGNWVLDRILGTPPPKPTVEVEAIEPDIRGATTIRDQLTRHRHDAACASCHVKIDPPGFALENFDVIGGWREHYRSIGDGEAVVLNGRRVRYLNGPIVDAADVLSDGRRFRNIDEYKQLLLEDKDQLARALAEKLVSYATGAAPSAAERQEIVGIVARVRDKDYGFRSLVHEIVQSQVFQRK